MSAPIINWVHEKGVVTEKDIKALERAKRIEARLEKSGYKWVKINERLKIFVPCDKNGKPTLEGQRRIAILKTTMGIK